MSELPKSGATVRLARFVLAHRRLVVLVWLLLLPAGIYGASHVSNRLKVVFSLPGQPGYETAQKLSHIYGKKRGERSDDRPGHPSSGPHRDPRPAPAGTRV